MMQFTHVYKDYSNMVMKYQADEKYSSLVLPIYMDEDRLYQEFLRLGTRLKGILMYASAYSMDKFGIPLVLTHIYRTQAEQDSIYRDDPKYKASPFPSVHQYNRGADARVTDMGVGKAKELAKEVNGLFVYRTGTTMQTCLVHDVGQGNHIHFQVAE
jgi:hypothetical protein